MNLLRGLVALPIMVAAFTLSAIAEALERIALAIDGAPPLPTRKCPESG